MAAARKTAMTKPAGPKSKQAKEDQETLRAFSDEVLADLPEASLPRMIEMHQMPRRQRADLLEQIQTLLPRLELVEEMAKQQGSTDAGAIMRFVADIEDLMATVAVDELAFRSWAGTVDDMQLLGLFGKYVSSVTSGEASSSSR